MTAYYSLVFAHESPEFLVENRDQIEEMAAIEKTLVFALDSAGISTRHEYASTDGSLSRFAFSALPTETLKETVEQAILGLPIQLAEITRQDGERDVGYVAGKQVRLDQMWGEE